MLPFSNLFIGPSTRIAVACRVGRQGIISFRQPLTGKVARNFRSTPSNGTSVRSKFGRSQVKPSDNESFQSITFDVGRVAVAAGAAVGIGGLCYYGLSTSPASSHSDAMSVFDRAAIWPDYVRQRVHSTYAYLAGGAGIAASTAWLLARSPGFCRLMMGSGIAAPIAMMVGSMAAGVICQMIPFPESGLGAKHVAWAVFSTSIGGMLVPICLIGGPVLSQAAVYTAGIVTGLSVVAASAPSERFLSWGGPLAIGLGVVFVSSLGSMFLSPATRVGSGLSAISLYGGLLLFSGFLLYDTQLVIKRAENHPQNNFPFGNQTYGGLSMPLSPAIRPFDPINNSIHILLDIVNIFVRMVAILSGSQRRK